MTNSLCIPAQHQTACTKKLATGSLGKCNIKKSHFNLSSWWRPRQKYCRAATMTDSPRKQRALRLIIGFIEQLLPVLTYVLNDYFVAQYMLLLIAFLLMCAL